MTAPFPYAEFCEELDTIFDSVELQTGLMSLHEIGHLAVGMALRPARDGQPTVGVTLAAGLRVPAEVQGLAWGVIDSQGALIATGRTTDLGQFEATLPAGRYRVRYVAEPVLWIDRTILSQIGDYAARFDMRRYDRDRTLPSPLPIEKKVKVPRDPTTLPLEDQDDDALNDLPQNVDVGFTRNHKYFKVRLADQICGPSDFPFGALLFQHVTTDGRMLGCRLAAIRHANEGRDIGNWIATVETRTLLGEQAETVGGEVIVWVVTADRPELLAAISPEEMTRYRNSPTVRRNPQLLGGAAQLEQLVRSGSKR